VDEPQSSEKRGHDVVHVGLLGYGNVGVAFTRLIDSQAEAIALRVGHELRVTRIAVRDLAKQRPGSALCDAGDRLSGDAASIVADPSIDVIVELIGGIEPARSLVLAALAAGKPVITANKELLATFGAELLSAAESGGVDLFYEASVAGAIPLVRLLNESLAGERIVRVMGIVNGTTNYMLTSMSEEGCDYQVALSEAQALGYAEPDPTADVEGFDARAKAAILAGIAFDADVVASDVYTEARHSLCPQARLRGQAACCRRTRERRSHAGSRGSCSPSHGPP
jgi:homoserine dehydrogenase